jgi:DsbC/DsbD-like thiol-disulfide interchange protein
MTLSSSRRWVGSLAVALLACVIYDAGPVLAQVKKSDSVVKATAKATKPDKEGKQDVTLTIKIEKPWHLYANPVDNEDFLNAQTVVTIKAKTKPEDVKITYPAGKLIVDATTGNYKVFEGDVTIKAKVKRAKGDTSPLQITIKLQACDDKRCLLPADVKLSVP